MNLAPRTFFPVGLAVAGVLLVGAAHYAVMSGGPRLADAFLHRGEPRPAWRCERAPCSVRRAALLESAPTLAGYGRVVPHRRDGVVDGLMLRGVPATSPWTRLALRDGDVVRAVNGLPLTTPERVLAAYKVVRSAPRMELSVVRQGRPVVLRYDLR